eukprot:CAMPEP_0184435290 /NCGR_PEP_ID=MMETSP0738-20130409/483781_1 /TAXON_ID=385413 /ORGANISM="Thalassiosira miniscula, Strain CCMP1093" /LENGTH=83 /DNA_ID=CAMNT_0026801613 /DNA_START=164 /DNA_END=415 /DNA_ORIENTATION=+
MFPTSFSVAISITAWQLFPNSPPSSSSLPPPAVDGDGLPLFSPAPALPPSLGGDPPPTPPRPPRDVDPINAEGISPAPELLAG